MPTRNDPAMAKLKISRFDVTGPVLIRPQRHADARGWFSEVWNEIDWQDAGLPETGWVQDNEVFSPAPGTLRGLHFQAPPHAQAKLVRVVSGAVFDVVVDIRKGSPTYGRVLTVTLSADTGDQLFVPAGFAHGYQTLSADTCVAYKCDGIYARKSEGGLLWSDPALGIDWPERNAPSLSDKDMHLPALVSLESPFSYSGG